jgi:hypothetical protein
MGFYSFNEDLQSAQRTEVELADLLRLRGKVVYIGYNDDFRWDLELTFPDGRFVTVEVKNDMMHERTGNLGVEFEYRGKPSGIDKTWADWWCFALYDGFWVIKTDKLRQLIADNLHFRVAVGGDPGSNTKMYLFRGHILKPYMQQLV